MKTIKSWKDIELSQTAKNAIQALKEGQVLALRMRHVNSSIDNLPKVQIEFAEKINGSPEGVSSAASIFNSKDDRFSSGAQRCWETADLSVAEQMFGKIPDEEASVEILKVLEDVNGKQFRIQVQEFLESQATDSELGYLDNYYKRAGKDGNFFYSAETGEKVCTRRRLVQLDADAEVPHTYIKGDYAEEDNANSVMTGSKSAVSSDLQNAIGG